MTYELVKSFDIQHSLCVAVLLCLFVHGNTELFTAIVEVENLLETHKRIQQDLNLYINKEEGRLLILKRFLNIYNREHEKAMEDVPNYLGNPINAFTLIKRLTTDLGHIKSFIKMGEVYTRNISMNHKDVKYPGQEDLTGAAQALTRLQKTYQLDVKEIAEGKLNGVAYYSTPLSTDDCFVLGWTLYKEKCYEEARAWLLEAYRKYHEEKIPYPFTDTNILEYISFTYYKMGDIRNALLWTHRVLDSEPNHARAKRNVKIYQRSIASKEARLWRQPIKPAKTQDEESFPLTTLYSSEEIYEPLCRGEVEVPIEITSSFKCQLLTENHPFLKIAPMKTETVYMDPDIILFHDVLSDNEIDTIKRLAKPKFRRAEVHNATSGQLVPAYYRISKSAWLSDAKSVTVARISRRVAQMTGLSMETAEGLQVANYGIGGHYVPHLDFSQNGDNISLPTGKRIATVLFYLSDVSKGGATVFPELGVSILPKKGMGVFWMNLHPSGEGDTATLHGACPVLQGSKWMCTKWLHQHGQEFLRPCDLDYQEEGFAYYIPSPVFKTSSLNMLSI